jgi:ABC-2 type transport system permease protein
VTATQPPYGPDPRYQDRYPGAPQDLLPPPGAPVNPYGDDPRRQDRYAGAPPQPRPAPPPAGGRPPSAFWAMCALMARTQLTRVRIAALLLLNVLAVASGVAYGTGVLSGAIGQPLVRGTELMNDFGIGFVIPVATLLFASSVFGELGEDKTLVYLWLRPVRRGRIVLAAAVTAFVITWPLVVPAMVVTAACTGGGRDLVLGTLLACTLGVAGYTGVFVALGARVRQPLVWGLLYIIIWEKYVAGASDITASVALRTYAAAVLRQSTGVRLQPQTPLMFAIAALMPLIIGGAALIYATRRLQRQDVA